MLTANNHHHRGLNTPLILFIMTATPNMPKHIQELIQLRELHGITLEQLANEMGNNSPSSVKKRLEEGPSVPWINRYKRAIEMILNRRQRQQEDLQTLK
jgi:predicted transcriptional regulator